MRIAFIGAGQFTVTAARSLIADGHEVVIVDQDNILAALARKRLGFGRVVVMIEGPDFGGLCTQLELKDVLVPSQETANAATDGVADIRSADLALLVEAGLRFFTLPSEIRRPEAPAISTSPTTSACRP